MPHPSVWSYGEAAPSVTDPYQGIEAETLGASSGGLAAGEVTPPHRRLSGSWKEALDPNEAGFWILLGLLVAVGVLHVKVGGRVGGEAGV